MSEDGKNGRFVLQSQLSEEDIYEAMKDVSGYLDVTPGDLKEIYSHAYQHALERIRNSIRASDLMTREVFTVFGETPLGKVAELMAQKGISGVPVIDSERHVLGVISEKDFSRYMGNNRSNNLMTIIADCINNQCCVAMAVRPRKGKDIMTAPAITVGEDAALGAITHLMASNDINRVPVVDSAGRLSGIISRADIVRLSFVNPR